MVALKTGRLYDRDIWPDIFWDQKQRLDKLNEVKAKFAAQGMDGHQLHFETMRSLESQQRWFPVLSERQKIMARIYPMQKKIVAAFTEEELDHLIARLEGANDELGQSILEKVKAMKLFSSRSS